MHNSGLRRLSLPQGAYLTERYRETSNSKASLSNIERQRKLVLILNHLKVRLLKLEKSVLIKQDLIEGHQQLSLEIIINEYHPRQVTTYIYNCGIPPDLSNDQVFIALQIIRYGQT